MGQPEIGGHPIVNIVGELVALGPLRREFLPFYLRWRNDFVVARTLDYDPWPATLEERAAWYERACADPGTIRFTVYERATWRPVGLANLHDLDYRHGTAEFGLVIA